MTYVDHVLNVLGDDENREVLVGDGRRYTRSHTRDLLLRLADGLHERGVRPGDGVAVRTGNSPEGALAQLAVHLLGARLVMAPPGHAPEKQAQVKGVIVEPGQDGWDISELPGEPVERRGVAGFTTVFATGGTTGTPKLPWHGEGLYEALAYRAQFPPVNTLTSTHITHGTGHVNTIMGLLTGGKVVLLPQPFDAGTFCATVREEQIHTTSIVTPQLYGVLDHPDCPGPGVFFRVGIGGSPIAPARLRQALERLGPVVWQGYGLSEALGVAMMDPADIDFDRPETQLTCGKPFPGLRVEIKDGTVHVGGPTVMKGYWGEPPLDGMVDTGDRGYLDAEGYLYIVDRSKDVIITGPAAGNVYSRLIDDLLVARPEIRHAAAVGAPDERYGEAVHLFVVPEPGHDVGFEDLRKALVAELGDLYEPRGMTVLERLPFTPVGKVDKQELRSTLW